MSAYPYVQGGEVTEFSPEAMICATCGRAEWCADNDGAPCPSCGSDNTVACGPMEWGERECSVECSGCGSRIDIPPGLLAESIRYRPSAHYCGVECTPEGHPARRKAVQ